MKKANMTYMDSVHHYGRVWNLSMMVLLLMFPAAVSIIFHAPADGKGLLMGLSDTVDEMERMGNPVHHDTLEARDFLLRGEAK